MALNVQSRVSLKVLTLLLLAISGGDSISVLTSSPSSVDGTLTACSGDEILLTCTHTDPNSGNTLWIINTSTNCSDSAVINHGVPDRYDLTCENVTFAFSNITKLEQDSTQLSSTAVAIAMASMSGSVIECRVGTLSDSELINNISLCIIAPISLQCTYTQRGLIVAWDSVGGSCYEGFVNYSVTVINRINGTPVRSLQGIVERNILVIEVESNQNYNISFKLKVSQSSCESEQLYAVCEDLDTSESTKAPAPMNSNSSTVIGAVVSFTIVIIAVIVAALIVIGILYKYNKLGCDRCNKLKRLDSGFKALEHQQDVNPNTITHAPSEDYNTDDKNELEPITTKKNKAYQGQLLKSDEAENPAHKSIDSKEYYKEMHHDEDKDGDHEHSLAMTVLKAPNGSDSKHQQYVDPDDLTRQPAPSGELYTEVFKENKDDSESGLITTKSLGLKASNDSDSKHQQYVDPDDLTRQPAPSGELYTEVFKENKDDSELEPITTKPDEKVNLARESIHSKENKGMCSDKDGDEDPKDCATHRNETEQCANTNDQETFETISYITENNSLAKHQ